MAMTTPRVPLPLRTRVAMFVRLLGIQGAWNYELMVGNGIGFCVEPALRFLPGGRDGPAYRAALARQAAYFNTHPYTAAVAVGALARVELDEEAPARIERFRTALCGPLGATGDRLIWAAWLPMSVLAGLLAFGLGAGPKVTVLTFLGIYNAAHIALRVWGLHVGYARGMDVARSLGSPVLRHGATWVSRVGAAIAGVAIPLGIARGLGDNPRDVWVAGMLFLVGLGGLGVARLHGRYEVWKWSLGLLFLVSIAATVLP